MLNRTMCDVLEEMRMCHKTHNYAPILGLVEEAQSMANRMEGSLYDKADYEIIRKRIKKEKAAHKVLLKETNKLRKEQGKEPKEMPRHP